MNEEWISDKTRHVVDGLRTQRLDQPYVRVAGRLQPVSWKEAFATIASKVRASSGKRIGALAGQLAGVEEMFALKSLMAKLGSKISTRAIPGRRFTRSSGERVICSIPRSRGSTTRMR